MAINFKLKITNIIKSYILPLLQVKDSAFQIVESGTKELANKLYLKAYINEDNDYKIVIDFEDNNISKIVRSIWAQLFSMFLYVTNSKISKDEHYIDALYENAYVWGIAQWLGGGYNNINPIIYDTIRQMIAWSMKTYEGNRVRFGVVINAENGDIGCSNDRSVKFSKFLQLDASASISDGTYTYFVVSNKGNIVRVSEDEVCVNNNKKVFAPIELTKICQASVNHDVGICLSAFGDIYCFKRQQLRVARLNGKWVIFSYESFYEILKSKNIDERLIDDIYNTCLDVSFARTGGCLAVCRHTNKLDLIMPKIEDINKKFPLFEYICEDDFINLPRSVRKEYMGIDGATIIDYCGKVMRIGAIINSVRPGTEGGGRKAAAQRLSEFGLAIKISADGYIQILKNSKVIKEFK